LLATFYQENLKYVRPGQPVEVARANGLGQYLPSDEIPKFQQPPPKRVEIAFMARAAIVNGWTSGA